MKKERWLGGLGALLLIGILFFAQWTLAAGAAAEGPDGAVDLYVRAAFPPVLLGLAAAAGLFLLGLRGRVRSALEWAPALAIAVIAVVAGGAPAFGGRYPAHEFRLPLLFWTLAGTALAGFAEALVRGRGRGFRLGNALWPAAAVLGACAAPAAFAGFFSWQVAARPDASTVMLARAGLTALYLLSGLALLPFARARRRGARWAALGTGAAYLLVYLLLNTVFAQSAAAQVWIGLGFAEQGCLSLPAGLVLAGLLPPRAE